MKLLILILFLLINCDHKVNANYPIALQGNPPRKIFLNYGKLPLLYKPEIKEEPWGPKLSEVEETYCLRSNKDLYSGNEWGPTLEICFDKTENNKKLLGDSLEALENENESAIRPMGDVALDNSNIHLSFKTATELLEQSKDSKEQLFFIGDKNLHKTVTDKFKQKEFLSVLSTKQNRIETSFAYSYFSIIAYDKSIYLVFSPSGKSASIGHYLVLDIIEANEIHDIIKNYISEVKEINSDNLKNCKKDEIKITELNASASISIKRFIEIKNNSDSITCFENISLETKSEKKQISYNGFMFPDSIKLISESGFNLRSIEVQLNWTAIKPESTVSLNVNNKIDKWELPKDIHNMINKNEFTLKRKPDLVCRKYFSMQNNLCGDPGMDLDIAMIPGNSCNPNDFQVTEVNPAGISDGSSVDKKGKFIEIHYTGSVICDLSSILLNIDSYKFPLYSEFTAIYPEEYIVIGGSNYLSKIRLRPEKNLDFISQYSNISISDYSNISGKTFKFALQTDNIIFSSSRNELYSLTFSGNNPTFHPESVSGNIYFPFSNFNNMSPGEENPPASNNLSAKISEISWMGSFLYSESIPEDEFLEIETGSSGSLILEIESESSLKKFFIPVSLKDRFITISREKFKCYPDTIMVTHENFTLVDEDTKIRIFNSSGLIEEVAYSPSLGNGINEYSKIPKLRSSYSYTNFSNIWTNSVYSEKLANIKRECYQETHSSPSEANAYEPILINKESLNDGTRSFYLISDSYSSITEIKYNHYSYLPPFNESSIANIFYDQNGVKLANISPGISLKGNYLVYQQLENSKDLKLFNRDGIYIEALDEDPEEKQNEWILLCNRGKEERNLSEYEIEDTYSSDKIINYYSRFNKNFPGNLDSSQFSGMEKTIKPGQCAYVLDPDIVNIQLNAKGILPTLIFTIISSTTIGNALSQSEPIDLFKYESGIRKHIHSFGNRHSNSPFKLEISTGDIISLKEGKYGESSSDYEVIKWK